MYQNRPRRFRRRSNGRNSEVRDNNDMTMRLRSNSFSNSQRSNSFSNSQTRNHFRTPQSAEKLLEKYNTLAKEAMSSGDKTLSENYFQHADHFMRIIENKNTNQNRVKADDKNLTENIDINQNLTVDQKEEKKE